MRDDGEGMTPEDALLAFARHATSKLTGADDLEAVPTLGFRGEALPSIAAAGAVRLVTRRAADTAAVAVEADASGAREAGPAAAPPGTLVEVRDLFATTPARRKFLRTTPTEVGHVVDLLTRLAVAWPETGFRLEHDGREVIAYPPVRDLRERLAQVLGARARRRDDRLRRGGERPLADGLPRAAARVAVDDTPRVDVRQHRAATGPARGAALGARSAAAARRAGRLRVAADARAATRWPCSSSRRAPGELDVNVHPAKLEVRFRRPQAVHQLIVSALRGRLAAALGPQAAIVRRSCRGVAEPTPRLRRRLAEAASGMAPPAPAGSRRCAAGESRAALWHPAPAGFASLRFIGQVLDGYLVCEGTDRVVLIDQHAAHERVRFERLRGRARRRPAWSAMRCSSPRRSR